MWYFPACLNFLVLGPSIFKDENLHQIIFDLTKEKKNYKKIQSTEHK